MPLQVVGLTTAIGVIRGTGSEAFAVGLVFSIVVRALHPVYHLAVPVGRLSEVVLHCLGVLVQGAQSDHHQEPCERPPCPQMCCIA